MSDTLRDLITRTLLANGTVTCAARADAILAALDAAGWTIVKRNTALTAAGDNPHDAPLARAALRVQAVAFQQTPATPNPGSIPAGEADTPSGGDINTQQQGGPVSALDYLIERLERASEELLGLRSQYDLASYEGNRLLGKRQGVELALSYAREAKRDDDNDAKAEVAFQDYISEEDQ